MKDNFQDSLIERLAEIEHERWSDWQAWCHKILRENCPSPGLEAVLERWDRQIATTYKDLSEQEKQSDRDQVNRYLPLLKDYIEAEIIGEDETNGQIQTRTIKELLPMRNKLRAEQREKLKALQQYKSNLLEGLSDE